MTPQPGRPEQGKFCNEEINFLKSYLPAYGALCDQLAEQATGSRGTGLVKGCKKDWVLSNVFPGFVKKFSSDQEGGPRMQSLQTKISRWFSNHSPHRSSVPGSKALTTPSPIKRPRATNGADVFAKEHRVKITEQMAEQQTQEGGAPEQVNLPRYRQIKQELYNQLTDTERRAYEAKAAETNEAYKAEPERSKIFENQSDIIGGVLVALNDLVGWGWGQYGEAIFFVQGAYRNAENKLKTFNVSVTPNAKTTSFSLTLPDYKEVFRPQFREWAENALPVDSPVNGATDISADQKYAIDLEEDGYPRFPVVDIDLVAPNDARSMLKAYIELAWKFATATVSAVQFGTVPWDLLDTVSHRRELLVDPDPFSHVKTLDPMRMSPHDVYTILALLLKGQASRVRLLEFSIEENYNSEADAEQEIDELLDPDGPTALPRDVDRTTDRNDVISELSNSTIQVPPSPAKRTADETCAASPKDRSISSAPANGVASLVIDPPSHASPPLSGSIIKAAIENVAKAGYLNISDPTTIHSTNHALLPTSKKSGKASRSDSKKRKREEQQGGPSEDRKPKKQAVPIREQSSRLKDANYKNKHVTVRPR